MVALEWRPDLSAHRPIFAARRLPTEAGYITRPISQSCYSHRDFNRRVKPTFEDKVLEEPDASGLRRLVLLKEAMRSVSSNMGRTDSGSSVATDTSDKLGVTMRFLRASESESLGTISNCLVRYPLLSSLVANPYEVGGNPATRLRAVKDHAVELAREQAMEMLSRAQAEVEDHDDFEVSRRRKKGSRLLYRLAPGKSDSIGAVIDDRGRFLTDPQAMADHLRQHWAEVFRARGVGQDRLKTWLDEDTAERGTTAPLHDALRNLRVRRRDIKRALKRSNDSAPGPDGIPYGAWRIMGDMAVEMLHAAFKILIRDDGPSSLRRDYPEFNESLLFFLPKKATSTMPDGGQAFEAGGVRPLNVTNCDNRILASTIRLVLEPRIGPLITKSQRGFLSGRSMLANILDVEESMIRTALDGENGWAFFYDMAAAFPSVEQEFFHDFFRRLGWPPWLLNIIRIFYQDNNCQICLAGSRFMGFAISRGIRQGCPLSPLLFAMATDLMLRRLQRFFPDATARAWADDLAMVLPKAENQLRELQCFF